MALLDNSSTKMRPPTWLRAANSLCGILPEPPAVKKIAEMPRLLGFAGRKTKLEDFGHPNFQRGLEVLVQSLNAEVSLSPIGRAIVQNILIDYLVNRLAVQAALSRDPWIASLPIRRPLFIVGLSRTGTTLLHNLLALAPDTRAPRTWELIRPAPPRLPTDPNIRHRIRTTQTRLRLLRLVAPRLRVVHPIEASAIEECYPLLNHTFTSPAFFMHYGVPRYLEWLLSVPLELEQWAYREYRTQLQVLQAHHPNHRWVLKSAVHLFSLRALLHVFPDALVVQTHRDPRKTIPSLCSLVSCFRNMICSDCPPGKLGAECLTHARTALVRGQSAREGHPSHQFMDIEFRELVRDPIGQVRKIHEHFNLGWDRSAEKNMRTWLAEDLSIRRGPHRYSMAQFGLDADQILTSMSSFTGCQEESSSR